MAKKVLITGANRGIGLEFTRQYLKNGWMVMGTCRRPSEADELNNLSDDLDGDLRIEELDVTDPELIDSVADSFQQESGGLDLLINNAGIYGEDSNFKDLTPTDLNQTFDVNCLGPFRLTQALLHALRQKTGNVVFVTSLMGSIEDNRSGGSYPYRVSKAALNMLGKTLAEDLRAEGIFVAILHPGWVKTRMGGPNAKISVEESVSGMREVIDQLDKHRSGEFYAYDGEKRPW